MPELPEVETMRRGILPIVGSTIQHVERPACQCRPILVQPGIDRFDRRVAQRSIQDVQRLGKRIILQLCDQQAIVIEPRMTGLVLLTDPPNATHLRLRIELANNPHRELLFWDRRGLGTVRLLSHEELQSFVTNRLGPDALTVSSDELRKRLRTSRRAVKVALLDQQAVAGIGNLYAAEILHVAGVDPRCRCDSISVTQWERIHGAIGLVLNEAIQHEGSTLSDGTYRNALNDPGSYQNHHRVYDRADQLCGRCGEANIRRIVQAQRSTFFCPKCQLRRGLHPTIA